MSDKVFYPENGQLPESQIGATLEALASTIARRREAGEESYTSRLLSGGADNLLKKVLEEAGEVALAAKDVEANASAAVDHLRYEAADVVYHLLVLLERYRISLDELAGELNSRMTDAERPEGAVQVRPDYLNRGK